MLTMKHHYLLIVALLIPPCAQAEVYNCDGTYYDGSTIKIIVNSDNDTINMPNDKIALNIAKKEHSNGTNYYTSNPYVLSDNKEVYMVIEDRQDDKTVMDIYDNNTRAQMYTTQLNCS